MESLTHRLTLLFENEQQARELGFSHDVLEARVTERTAELEAANRKLKEQDHFIRRIVSTAPTIIYIYDIEE